MNPIKLIFLSLVQIDNLNDRGIYHDLLRQFVANGHEVTVVCPVERRTRLHTRIIKENGTTILQVRTLNLQKSALWEKGLATLSLNFLLQQAIQKYLKGIEFDLILYATPPITITGLLRWLKKRDGAKTYLLLKDIFPQNAVDMGMFSQTSFLHNYFRRKEKLLYSLSDRIGCMSPANVTYLKAHNPEVYAKAEVNPNSIDLSFINQKTKDRKQILQKWGINQEAVLFLYGGNLGKPQGTTFLLNLIEKKSAFPKAYFLIVGDGTDYSKLDSWFKQNNPANAKLIQRLPKAEFDELASCCDVGLILLRKEFTIPNFPSRLLTYLENKMPILAITDKASDIGSIAETEGFGKWCLYGSEESATQLISFFEKEADLRRTMGQAGFNFMQSAYNVKTSYLKIIDFVLKAS
jgi:glycosyltransferase involved in cell wall biosynthesis